MTTAQPLPVGRLAAEFGVIVIGVLVALAADRWRETRGDTERRSQYMVNLIADVEADSGAFLRASRPSTGAMGSAVLAVARGKSVHPDSLPQLLYAIEALQWYNPPVTTKETYEDLVSTGNLNLLRPALRRVLAQYYNRVSLTEQREELFRNVLVDGYRHAPSQILGPELHPAVFDRIQAQREQRLPDVPVLWSVDSVDRNGILRRLRETRELERWIAERLYIDRQHAEIYGDRLYRQSIDLLRMLRGVRDGTIAPAELRFSTDALRS